MAEVAPLLPQFSSSASNDSIEYDESRSWRKTIACRIGGCVLAVGAVANTFRCAFDLLLEWEDETFAPVLRRELPFGAIAWSRHFRPRWTLLNAVEISYLADDSQAHYAVAAHRDTGRCVVRQARRVVGTFFEHMALRAFPLDVQALSIVVACDVPQAAETPQHGRTGSPE